MTSSGTYNYSLSLGEAVIGAYERCGIHLPTLRQEHWVTARREINDLFIELSNRQLNLWKVELRSVALVQGTASYNLLPNVVTLLDVYRTTTSSGGVSTDIYMTAISRTDYATISVKSTQAPPTSYWFDRTIAPTVYLWPTPDGNGPYTLNYYAAIQLQDANIPGGETPDMPYRFQGVLMAGLAMRLARVYAPQMLAERKIDYQEAWTYAATEDTEISAFTISPYIGGYYPR
jgi:hypothetical protein